MANEYLQAYNTSTGVKSFVFFCSLHQSKCAGCTRFMKTFVVSNLIFRNYNRNFYKALGQNSIRRRSRKRLTARAAFLFMASLSFYGRSFFLCSLHIGRFVSDNTCYRLFTNFLFALLQFLRLLEIFLLKYFSAGVTEL